MAALEGQLVIGEAEALLKPFQESRLEDVPRAVEGVAGQPDQLRLAEGELADGVELGAQLVRIDGFGKAGIGVAVHQGESGPGCRKNSSR